MNLLRDAWIPMAAGRRVTLEEVLCSTAAVPHPAMANEMLSLALYQLLSALVQTVASPTDSAQWTDRFFRPLTPAEYTRLTASFLDWFGMDHPDHPYLQALPAGHPGAGAPTSVQRLIMGYPGDTAPWLRHPESIKGLCPTCTAIALYDIMTCGQGIAGPISRDPLRGNGPLSTLVWRDDLRQMIWANVLTDEWLMQHGIHPSLPGICNDPTWVTPIKVRECLAEVGVTRGLFLTPMAVRLAPPEQGKCDLCSAVGPVYREFRKVRPNSWEKRPGDDYWRHPYTPYAVNGTRAAYAAMGSDVAPWMGLINALPIDTTRIVRSGQNEKTETVRVNAAPVQEEYMCRMPTREPLKMLCGGYIMGDQIIESRYRGFIQIPTFDGGDTGFGYAAEKMREYLDCLWQMVTAANGPAFAVLSIRNSALKAKGKGKLRGLWTGQLTHRLQPLAESILQLPDLDALQDAGNKMWRAAKPTIIQAFRELGMACTSGKQLRVYQQQLRSLQIKLNKLSKEV